MRKDFSSFFLSKYRYNLFIYVARKYWGNLATIQFEFECNYANAISQEWLSIKNLSIVFMTKVLIVELICTLLGLQIQLPWYKKYFILCLVEDFEKSSRKKATEFCNFINIIYEMKHQRSTNFHYDFNSSKNRIRYKKKHFLNSSPFYVSQCLV